MNNDQLFRQALQRQNDRAAGMQMPADMEQRVMRSIKQGKLRRRWPLTVAIGAVAASIVLLTVLSFWPKQAENRPMAVNERTATERTTEKDTIPNTVGRHELVEAQLAQVAQGHSPDKERTAKRTPKAETAQKEPAKEQAKSVPVPADSYIHYAADVTTIDTTRIAPARLNEFIAKFADYNGVPSVALDCSTVSTRNDVTSTAYVFPDAKEVDVFGRLLLAAVAYSDTMPGYLLNYSHRQFFFTLHDEQIGRKYLWIAERIGGGRILLYSTHSPINAEVSSACFQTYREKLTNTSITPKTTEL